MANPRFPWRRPSLHPRPLFLGLAAPAKPVRRPARQPDTQPARHQPGPAPACSACDQGPTHTRPPCTSVVSSPRSIPASPAQPAQPARTLTVAAATTTQPASLVHPSTLPPTPSIHSSSTSPLFYNHPSFVSITRHHRLHPSSPSRSLASASPPPPTAFLARSPRPSEYAALPSLLISPGPLDQPPT